MSNSKPIRTAFPIFAFIIIMGILFCTLTLLFVTMPKKGENHKYTEEVVLIKKVEIIPYTYIDTDSVSIKVTIEELMQCDGHPTTVLYNNFSGRAYLNLLLPIAYPDRKYYINYSNSKFAWRDDKCLIMTVCVKPIQSAIKENNVTEKVNATVKKKVGEVGLKPAFKFIF